MENDNQFDKLFPAMCQFHAKAGGVVQYDSTNPFFKSKYASLGAVIDVINKYAPDCGLSWIQLPISSDKGIGVKTTVIHESGQYFSESMAVPFGETVIKQDRDGSLAEISRNVQQEAGSVITYLRRYGLAAAFGLYADEDNDGNRPDQIGAEAGKTTGPKANQPGQQQKASATAQSPSVQVTISEPEVPIDPDFPDQGSYVKPEAFFTNPKVSEAVTKTGGSTYVKPEPSLKTTPAANDPSSHERRIHPTVHEGEQFGYALRATLDGMNFSKPATEKQIPFLEMLMVKLIPDEAIRHEVRWDILRVNDFKKDPGLAHPRIAAFLKWLNPSPVETGEFTATGKKRVTYVFPEEVTDAIAMACVPYVTL